MSDAADRTEARARFEFARVARRGFSAMAAHLPLLIGASLILVAAPESLVDWARRHRDAILSATLHAPATTNLFVKFLIDLPALAVQQIVWVFFVAWMCRVMILKMEGARPAPAAQFRLCVTHIGPLALLAAALGGGAAVGAVLLIVPAFMFAAAAFVAIPAMIFEDLGPRGALIRSFQLTRGSRWEIFGLFAAYSLVFLVVGLSVDSLVAGPRVKFEETSTVPLNAYFVIPIRSAVQQVVAVAMTASAYYELAISRGDRLAEIFG